ncbi:hypothetical protein [Butyricicoccus sp. Marseille-Q5471]|uniref:hypothetical protein n=1 Tax=Butyricicoccus sp. Marseille-Q5471 TaxID=3039493 RepID=UPI0024BCAEEB|nr:hypothetical protein [Butyricicoccus sp. Marseille-Q5471]
MRRTARMRQGMVAKTADFLPNQAKLAGCIFQTEKFYISISFSEKLDKPKTNVLMLYTKTFINKKEFTELTRVGTDIATYIGRKIPGTCIKRRAAGTHRIKAKGQRRNM